MTLKERESRINGQTRRPGAIVSIQGRPVGHALETTMLLPDSIFGPAKNQETRPCRCGHHRPCSNRQNAGWEDGGSKQYLIDGPTTRLNLPGADGAIR